MPIKQKQTDSAPPPRALYVHVPFCRAKCRYCDFHSAPLTGRAAQQFVVAATRELDRHRTEFAEPLASVFFGGGTPTVLGAALLGRLIDAAAPLTGPDTEFSVEANPATLDKPLADHLAAGGVNRINLGVQSFDDGELRLLGRIHTAADAADAVDMLRTTGIANVGLDLIYGIPGQTMESWRRSLGKATALAPAHLSCYALSFEAGTPLGEDLAAGRAAEMDESLQRDCYDAAITAAGEAGLEHYEISNFARAGQRCRHNLTYWRNEPYVGIGPAAASYVAGERRTNDPDTPAYIDALLSGREPPATAERLGRRAAMAETLMLNLRLIEGADRAAFARRFGTDPLEAFPLSFSRYAKLGAVIVTPSHVRIAPQSLFVADSILADLIDEAAG